MPFLAPISENGRPMSTICSFCGTAIEGIRSLDCGYHSICDVCSNDRLIYYECPLCASRDRHLVESAFTKRGINYGNLYGSQCPNNCYPMYNQNYTSTPYKPVPTSFSLPSQLNYGVPSVSQQCLPLYKSKSTQGSIHVTSHQSTYSHANSYPYATPISIQQEIDSSFQALQGEAVADSEVSDARHQKRSLPAIPVNYQTRGVLTSSPSIPSYQPQYTMMARSITTPVRQSTFTPSEELYITSNRGEESAQPAYPVNAIQGNEGKVSKAYLVLNEPEQFQDRNNLVLKRQKNVRLDENSVKLFRNLSL